MILIFYSIKTTQKYFGLWYIIQNFWLVEKMFDKIDWFIKVYDGIKYLVLFGGEIGFVTGLHILLE